MREALIVGTAAAFISLGGIESHADSNVPSRAPYAVAGYGGAPSAMGRRAMIEGRATHTDVVPEDAVNGYVGYRSVGLSGNSEDCNRGCALSNGS